jgi:hypothetical protein
MGTSTNLDAPDGRRDQADDTVASDTNGMTSVIRRTLARARQLPTRVARQGGWPLALGAMLLVASTASVVATANTPPKIESATFRPHRPVEGEEALLTVKFSDPNLGDFHTLRVRWRDDGDRGPSVHEMQVPAGQTFVQIPHTFKDAPTDGTIQIAILDRQMPPGAPNDNTEGAGKDLVFAPAPVINAAPNFVGDSIQVQKQDRRKVLVVGEVADPGALDTLKVRATWGMGQGAEPTPCGVDTASRRFYCEHTYVGPWGGLITYVIGLEVTDDEGASSKYKTSVRI